MRTPGLLLLAITTVASAHGDVLTFENDYPGFVDAAGPLSMIDFETLPDGSPSPKTSECIRLMFGRGIGGCRSGGVRGICTVV